MVKARSKSALPESWHLTEETFSDSIREFLKSERIFENEDETCNGTSVEIPVETWLEYFSDCGILEEFLQEYSSHKDCPFISYLSERVIQLLNEKRKKRLFELQDKIDLDCIMKSGDQLEVTSLLLCSFRLTFDRRLYLTVIVK